MTFKMLAPYLKYRTSQYNCLELSKDQASRVISTGQLNTSPCLHLQPINLVVFQDSSGNRRFQGDLILGGASCLDAFSAYPFRT